MLSRLGGRSALRTGMPGTRPVMTNRVAFRLSFRRDRSKRAHAVAGNGNRPERSPASRQRSFPSPCENGQRWGTSLPILTKRSRDLTLPPQTR